LKEPINRFGYYITLPNERHFFKKSETKRTSVLTPRPKKHYWVMDIPFLRLSVVYITRTDSFRNLADIEFGS